VSMYVGLGKFREVSVRDCRMPSYILGWDWKKVVFLFFVNNKSSSRSSGTKYSGEELSSTGGPFA
jgi:hypothetical protein